MKVPWDLEDEVKKGKGYQILNCLKKGGHKNSSTKGWERVVKIEVVSFLFPSSSILKGGKKLLFWHALPLPTIQDGLEWEEPDIRLKQASWEDTIYFQITTQIKLVHTQCWKMILPFWDCESDKCFLLSFESPWKWQKQCNKVLKSSVKMLSIWSGFGVFSGWYIVGNKHTSKT